ncbi:hypothetical protein SAMN06265348_110278 [Pedobacter westerhofensis]|uniref:Uncharacterized protein n=1 Tax=Pedobacter westerhofensis TaxID=425512 RepID=A0A521F8D5_9SPHI|nr:hypothetical protein SAMN06265348_110278 [Pedobacter westerhofensis]
MKLKRYQYILISILILLLVTNPSPKTFLQHLHQPEDKYMSRDYNFFVCSIYSYKVVYETVTDSSGSLINERSYRECYLGVFGNFIMYKIQR